MTNTQKNMLKSAGAFVYLATAINLVASKNEKHKIIGITMGFIGMGGVLVALFIKAGKDDKQNIDTKK